jgi:diguanylate cyclase (GGDEF)-like protein
VTRSLTEAESASGAVVRAIQAFCGLTGWMCGVHWILDPNDGVLRCEHIWHLPNNKDLARLANVLSSVSLGSQDTHTLGRRVLAKGMPSWAADLTEEGDSAISEALHEAGLRSAFAFPVRVDGDAVGVLEFFGRERREPDEDLLRLAGQLGGLIGQHIARRETEQRLQFVVSHDPLTGLPNRTIFSQRLGQAIAQATRHEHKVSLLFVDLDGFKAVNDRLGHREGDALLVKVAQALQKSVRADDAVGRFGGDEFLVLASVRNPSGARALALHMLEAIRQVSATVSGGGVSASIGYALSPADAQHPLKLLQAADDAMYAAKRLGKDRVQHGPVRGELRDAAVPPA